MIPILILAAGQSTRMRGRDKLLEPVDGMPLLRQRVLTALAVSRQVSITLPDRDHPRGTTVFDLPIDRMAGGAIAGRAAKDQVIGADTCDEFGQVKGRDFRKISQ